MEERDSGDARGGQRRGGRQSELRARPACGWGSASSASSALGPALGLARGGRVSCAVLSCAGRQVWPNLVLPCSAPGPREMASLLSTAALAIVSRGVA